MNDLATKEFFHNELEKVRQEIVALENRRAMGKMLAFTVGTMLAGVPIILALAQML